MHATDYVHITYHLLQPFPLMSRVVHCQEVAELEDQEFSSPLVENSAASSLHISTILISSSTSVLEV